VHRGGRTDRPTDRPTQSLIEVLFAPKKKSESIKVLEIKLGLLSTNIGYSSKDY
jgi:hypothetical protein